MKLINKKLGYVALKVPNILFPKNTIDLKKWSIIACDQYTSNIDYWKEVSKTVGNSPSTLKLILPEVYLESPNVQKMLKKIPIEMKKYLRRGTIKPLEAGFIYIERITSYGNIRKGLLTCIDLEQYDYNKGSLSMIRPTEKTILDRIPPRVKIRENALIELPHIMLLIDDPQKMVIESFTAMKNSYKKLYDFDLMQEGGHITGYHINAIQDMEHIYKALNKLMDDENYKEKYGNNKNKMLFAVGDGNHSLAAAKFYWNTIKKALPSKDINTHPARYALVEIVNIHDKNLKFEPIHRILFNTDLSQFIDELNNYNAQLEEFDTLTLLKEKVFLNAFNNNEHVFGIISNNKYILVTIKNITSAIACGTIQNILDKFIEKNNSEIDFIHDLDSLVNLTEENNVGLLLPPIDKSSFFKTIIEEGTLPRKTFSMGHADEKRFYLETRKIQL